MIRVLLAAALVSVVSSCGGGDGPVIQGGAGGFGQTGTPIATPTDGNALALTVDPGPQNVGYTNGLFASVTLCEPGTSNCQTIDHLLVDTGSVGVRVLESELTLNLPAASDASGAAMAQCMPFVDGTAWGPVHVADVQMGGEGAANVPIQIIGEQSFTMPADCTGSPITNFETLDANGILGIGIYLQDCGADCTQPAHSLRNPGVYYGCTSASACSVISVPLANQVPNPVSLLPVDNNGTIIELPNLPAGGATFAVGGWLVFGIGTQTNNGLGSTTVLPLDTFGNVTTTFPAGGTGYTSYIDSGSNALFFLNSATTNLTQCTSTDPTNGIVAFYCPGATTHLSAAVVGANQAHAQVAFSVANASRLNGRAFAFDNLAGPMPGFPFDTTVPGFDWGLPFFFGRNVFTAIEAQPTPGGTGPYFAF